MRKLNRQLKMKLDKLMQAGLIAWNGRKLRLPKRAPRVRGKKTVAEILLENREADS